MGIFLFAKERDFVFEFVKEASGKPVKVIVKEHGAVGDDYGLVVLILFRRGKAFIWFVGTHKEYDKIKAKDI